MVILPTPAMASRALTHRLARIWSIWDGSTLTGHRSAARQPGEVDVLADQPPQHLEHACHGLVQVQHLGRDGLLAGKGQQLPGEVGGALGRLADFLQVGMERLRRVHLLEGQLRMPEDHPQHVVEVVRHAARQPAHRFHLLGLVQLRFELAFSSSARLRSVISVVMERMCSLPCSSMNLAAHGPVPIEPSLRRNSASRFS